MRFVKTTRRLAIMTVRSVILLVKPLLKLFVIAWAILVSKVYYNIFPFPFCYSLVITHGQQLIHSGYPMMTCHHTRMCQALVCLCGKWDRGTGTKPFLSSQLKPKCGYSMTQCHIMHWAHWKNRERVSSPYWALNSRSVFGGNGRKLQG